MNAPIRVAASARAGLGRGRSPSGGRRPLSPARCGSSSAVPDTRPSARSGQALSRIALSSRLMRHQHHRHRLARGCGHVAASIPATPLIAQDRRHIGNHPGPVHHHQPQIIRRRHARASAPTAHRQRSRAARPRPASADPRAISIRSATTAEAVGPAPAPTAFQHHAADEIALRHHGVEHAIDRGDRRRFAAPCTDAPAPRSPPRSAARCPAA